MNSTLKVLVVLFFRVEVNLQVCLPIFLLFLITSIGFCMRNHVGSCSKQYLAVKFPVFIPLSFENNPCKVVAGT